MIDASEPITTVSPVQIAVAVEPCDIQDAQPEIVVKGGDSPRRDPTPVADAHRRLAAAGLTLAFAAVACNAGEQITPSAPAKTEPTAPIVWVSPTPLPQILQPTSTRAPADQMPVEEALLPMFDVTATPEQVYEEDPLFVDRNSYVLKQPTEIMQTTQRAEEIANATLQRLRDLGIVQDQGRPVTVTFNGIGDGTVCEADSANRNINCENSDRQYLRPDASLITHELIHIVEEDSPSRSISELRAVMGAFILSGRNPQILDRYLFATGFATSEGPIVFSASDIVYGLEAQGISEREMLNFVFNYEANIARITQASIQWMEGQGDFSKNAEFIIAAKGNGGAGFVPAMVAHRWGINAYNQLLSPDVTVDNCRANIMPTKDLLALVGPQCVILK